MMEMHLILKKIEKEKYTEKSKEVIMFTEILMQMIARLMKLQA